MVYAVVLKWHSHVLHWRDMPMWRLEMSWEMMSRESWNCDNLFSAPGEQMYSFWLLRFSCKFHIWKIRQAKWKRRNYFPKKKKHWVSSFSELKWTANQWVSNTKTLIYKVVIISQNVHTIELIFIVILTMFRPIYPLAFFKYFMSNSGVHIESQTEPFIWMTGVD